MDNLLINKKRDNYSRNYFDREFERKKTIFFHFNNNNNKNQNDNRYNELCLCVCCIKLYNQIDQFS